MSITVTEEQMCEITPTVGSLPRNIIPAVGVGYDPLSNNDYPSPFVSVTPVQTQTQTSKYRFKLISSKQQYSGFFKSVIQGQYVSPLAQYKGALEVFVSADATEESLSINASVLLEDSVSYLSASELAKLELKPAALKLLEGPNGWLNFIQAYGPMLVSSNSEGGWWSGSACYRTSNRAIAAKLNTKVSAALGTGPVSKNAAAEIEAAVKASGENVSLTVTSDSHGLSNVQPASTIQGFIDAYLALIGNSGAGLTTPIEYELTSWLEVPAIANALKQQQKSMDLTVLKQVSGIYFDLVFLENTILTMSLNKSYSCLYAQGTLKKALADVTKAINVIKALTIQDYANLIPDDAVWKKFDIADKLNTMIIYASNDTVTLNWSFKLDAAFDNPQWNFIPGKPFTVGPGTHELGTINHGSSVIPFKIVVNTDPADPKKNTVQIRGLWPMEWVYGPPVSTQSGAASISIWKQYPWNSVSVYSPTQM